MDLQEEIKKDGFTSPFDFKNAGEGDVMDEAFATMKIIDKKEEPMNDDPQTTIGSSQILNLIPTLPSYYDVKKPEEEYIPPKIIEHTEIQKESSQPNRPKRRHANYAVNNAILSKEEQKE